jgi:hypothetical protein
MQNILNLIVKKQWFDKILSGEKSKDFRDHTSYWDLRLDGKDGFYSIIRFQLGYSPTAIFCECKGIKKDFKNDLYVVLIGNKLTESEVFYGEKTNSAQRQTFDEKRKHKMEKREGLSWR